MPAAPAFASYARKAQRVAKNKRSAKALLEEVATKLKKTPDFKTHFKRVWKRLQPMVRLVRAYVVGEYRAVPWNSIVLAVAALLYFVTPLDFIPDWMPGVGLLDDVGVMGMVLASIHKDLVKFQRWEREQKGKTAPRTRPARAAAARRLL